MERIAGRQELIEWLSQSSVNKRQVARNAEISERHLLDIINGKVPLSKDIHMKLNAVLNHFRTNPSEYARRSRETRGRSTNRVPVDMIRLSCIWEELFVDTTPPIGKTKVARALIDYLLRIRLLKDMRKDLPKDNKDGLLLPDYRAIENWRASIAEGKLVPETKRNKENRMR